MFEHSQQVKHLGTSQTSSEAVRKLFLKMAAPQDLFSYSRPTGQHVGQQHTFVEFTSGQAAIPQLVHWPCFHAVSRYSHYYSSRAYMHSPIMFRVAVVHSHYLNIGSGSHTHNYYARRMLAKLRIMLALCSVL